MSRGERVGDALARAAYRLGGGAAARREAALLLAAASGRDRGWQIAHRDDALDAHVARRLDALAARRAAGEPVAYLLGRREFWSLELAVSPAVLIPRPETELLVERALALLAPGAAARVCDAGTGSGAVAIAIARERPAWRVIGCERSAPALAVAAANVRRLAPGRVALLRGDWLAALADRCLDLLASNPPYVPAGDPHLARGDLRFEPREALAAGADGLAALRVLAAEGARCLRAGGWLLVEHGAEQGGEARRLLAGAGFAEVCTHRDLAGHERVTQGRLPAGADAGMGRGARAQYPSRHGPDPA